MEVRHKSKMRKREEQERDKRSRVEKTGEWVDVDYS